MPKAVLFCVLVAIVMAPPARAQKAGHATTGTKTKTNTNTASNAAAEKAMMREQEQMLQQQQAFEREQMKLYQAQEKAMQLQALQQRKMLLEHLQASQNGTSAMTRGTSSSPATTASTVKSSATTHKGKSSSSKHGVVHVSYWHVWPRTSSTAAYRNLMSLKQTLDTIANTRQPVGASHTTLQNKLYAVHNNNAISPSRQHVSQLASDITTALVNRSKGTTSVDTRNLALHLRAVMNTPYLNVSEFQTSVAQQQSILEKANVPAQHIESVVKDVQGLAEDVLVRSM